MSSETSVLTRATWHSIPEDTILHSHRRENLKSYIFTLHLPNLMSIYIGLDDLFKESIQARGLL
jgi:hypothetical protein